MTSASAGPGKCDSTPAPEVGPVVPDYTYNLEQTLSRTLSRTLSPNNNTKEPKPDLEPIAVAPPAADKGPWGWRWRSADWFITAVVAWSIASDNISYAIIVPVIPFHLEKLGYDNLSSRTGYLLFAYSGGILIATFPVAYFFHRYRWRRGPLIIAVFVMEASFIMFMLGNHYVAMIMGRILQGACSCVVWTVGMALITENIDEKNLGKHIGIALTGFTLGTTIGPPVGGALYKRLGWNSPFIFCIVINAVDLLVRLLVLEKRLMHNWHPTEKARLEVLACAEATAAQTADGAVATAPGDSSIAASTTETAVVPTTNPATPAEPKEEKQLSPFGVIVALLSIPRGMAALTIAFIFGLMYGAMDASLALHVNDTWGKDSETVGFMFLARGAPEFFIGPVAGWVADKFGPEWLILPAILINLPWLPLLTLRKSIVGFFIVFACTGFTENAINIGASIELAYVSKMREGIGSIHQFAALNLAFSVSLAVGSVIGGQIYDHVVPKGWDVICWMSFGGSLLLVVPPLFWAGDRPLGRRWRRKHAEVDEAAEAGAAPAPTVAEK
ncbi:putative MFS-type transporter2 [Vanrija pseudolonga]|uniref:Purtative MFS-type transporter2 n=1 Tax=Vanrija pseudolonga TaxID=143232 RepID=A0AAF1BJW2_9TREE|nr:purtative MFS-type transporter2 [Vanrija pseudolonga]